MSAPPRCATMRTVASLVLLLLVTALAVPAEACGPATDAPIAPVETHAPGESMGETEIEVIKVGRAAAGSNPWAASVAPEAAAAPQGLRARPPTPPPR